MSNLICKNTMRACQTPGMCAPHGGCKPAAGQLVHPDDHAKLRSDYAALEAECERLTDELDRRSVIQGDWIARCQRLADERDALAAEMATIKGGVAALDRNAAFKACPDTGCDWSSFYSGWKAAIKAFRAEQQKGEK